MAKPVKHGSGWRIRWINQDGVRKSECFVTYKDAEFALKKYEAETQEIRLGLRLPTLPNKNFLDLCDAFLKYRSSRKRNPEDDESIIRVHLKPFFNDIKLTSLGSKVNDFILLKSDLNPKTLHNILTLLISMLRFAFEERWIATIPRIKKPKIRLLNSDYRYLRNRDEINRFLYSAKSLSDFHYTFYATAIFTGLRAGELAGLLWTDIDLSKRLITVQRSFNGPTKNGEIRYVPILDALLPILIKWRTQSDSHLVFPNEADQIHQESSRVFQEHLHKVLEYAQLPKVFHSGKWKRYIVFHDLRHTFASQWMMNGGNIFKLQKILGHKSHQMTQRYAHLEPEAFTEDFDRFGTSMFESKINSKA